MSFYISVADMGDNAPENDCNKYSNKSMKEERKCLTDFLKGDSGIREQNGHGSRF